MRVNRADTLLTECFGPAALIVEYRQQNGPFKKIEELMNVRGVGEKNFLKLQDQISVGNAKADHDQPPQR